MNLEVGKTYYFELYEGKGFKAKVTEIRYNKFYLDNDESIDFENIKRAIEIYQFNYETNIF